MTEKGEKTLKTESEGAHELAAQVAQEGMAEMAQAAETLDAARDAEGEGVTFESFAVAGEEGQRTAE